MFDLDRFRRAQEAPLDGFASALTELRTGGKQGHWIWYVFPQLQGLGRSATAVHYGLQGAAEAAAYLHDPVLRERLLAVTSVVAAQLAREPPPALDALMGSDVDALKLVSSMTLFREVARRLHAVEPVPELADLAGHADSILRAAAGQGFPECASTLRHLTS